MYSTRLNAAPMSVRAILGQPEVAEDENVLARRLRLRRRRKVEERNET